MSAHLDWNRFPGYVESDFIWPCLQLFVLIGLTMNTSGLPSLGLRTQTIYPPLTNPPNPPILRPCVPARRRNSDFVLRVVYMRDFAVAIVNCDFVKPTKRQNWYLMHSILRPGNDSSKIHNKIARQNRTAKSRGQIAQQNRTSKSHM